jgi:hypothetical protein
MIFKSLINIGRAFLFRQPQTKLFQLLGAKLNRFGISMKTQVDC